MQEILFNMFFSWKDETPLVPRFVFLPEGRYPPCSDHGSDSELRMNNFEPCWGKSVSLACEYSE